MRVLKAIIFSAVILCLSCDEDDYNKNEFRCVINGERLSVPDDGVRIFDKYPPTYIRWVDSSRKSLLIYGELRGNPYERYLIEMKLDSFTGVGTYTYPRLRGTLKSDIGYSFYNMNIDTTVQAVLQLNYFNVTNGAAGYFHFMAVDSLSNLRVPVTNGRFNLKWLKY